MKFQKISVFKFNVLGTFGQHADEFPEGRNSNPEPEICGRNDADQTMDLILPYDVSIIFKMIFYTIFFYN